ncbi:MAG: 2-C-methyl-D-erythritol 4-phosphate cytidylyltransferase [Bacteroidales bacterium]|nr:2-C-methyl-D-erythritol 4-phosphate cytidylyltransferase [Bacteroidales bacterium]
MKQFAIITGGGTGSRIGTAIPKQFLSIHGLPILIHTINQFLPLVDSVVVSLPKEYVAYWKEIQVKYNFHVSHILVDGGETRFHSVKNALHFIPDDGLVAVHDAVRPFVTSKLIRSCFKYAQEHGTAVAAIPLKDTLRMVSGRKSQSVNRSDFYRVQTPQVFACEMIKKAYQQVYRPDFTDDASVVEAFGEEIHLVDGEETNIKITTPTDLALAEILMCQNKIQ